MDLEGRESYTSQIGNDFHLDLINAEDVVVHDLNGQQRVALLRWADGITDEAISTEQLGKVKPGALRKRRQRAIESLQERLNDGEPS